MNNDLISREALIKAVEDLYEYAELDEVLDVIKAAPTVEPFEPDYVGAERLKARQRGYEEGYHNGMNIGKRLNPKIKRGEWLEFSNAFVECSECNYHLNCKTNFCPNCGADMTEDSEA